MFDDIEALPADQHTNWKPVTMLVAVLCREFLRRKAHAAGICKPVAEVEPTITHIHLEVTR